MSLFGELGRRNVIRVGIACAIVAWLRPRDQAKPAFEF